MGIGSEEKRPAVPTQKSLILQNNKPTPITPCGPGRLFHVGLEEKRGIRGINPHSGGRRRRRRESPPKIPKTHILMRLFKISSPDLSRSINSELSIRKTPTASPNETFRGFLLFIRDFKREYLRRRQNDSAAF